MTKRIIEIGTPGSYLKFKNQQLIIERFEGEEQRSGVSLPIEDLSAVVLDTPQATITQYALKELLKANVAVVCSDEQHMPVGMWLPLDGNSLQGERFSKQADMAAPLKKRLWQQLIRVKVAAQAKVLKDLTGTDKGIAQLVKKVKSGDPDNIEALAARRYWSTLFKDANIAEDATFKRNREAPDQNRYLNYAYAILRGLVARNLVATGLHPCLGLHHHNKYNAYALADDVMEPYRPFADMLVWQVVRDYGAKQEMDREICKELLGIVKFAVMMNKEQYTLQGAIQKTCQSLSAAIGENQALLCLPDF